MIAQSSRKHAAVVSAIALALAACLSSCAGKPIDGAGALPGATATAGSAVTTAGPTRTLSPPAAEVTLPAASASATAVPGAPAHPAGAGEAEIQRLAVQNLAQRLSLPEEQIRVMRIDAVVWPDASLGCPQPGMAYAQVLTPGYLLVLEAGGQQYEYHADDAGNARVVLCPSQ